MPFDYKKYDQKCSQMTTLKLQEEWEHHTRVIYGASTSTAVSGLALPLTGGISAIEIVLHAPVLSKAEKKLAIIDRHLKRHDTTRRTRKRDALSGIVSVVTLGMGGPASFITEQIAERVIGAVVSKTAIEIATHAAFDATALTASEAHHNHKRQEAAKRFAAEQQMRI